ncbi:FKBP-type peptidyl-prolyl cis-trans isomerase [Piscinibacter koreensis]|uniref:peptidylprolyl isomerase n=1 Tax=Piscinibacter koreensis TaxID=2742824 RepID=A0A7Y6NKY9_9BURK|nr:FKBP-type peptidyl-prolyl cis-trans isomerase [Schlegelella koreensis]NUZ05034.1 FKBP-type peptidyl-prolyl cis-trans isomerase [Schlegelella koreensis]
MHVTAPCVVTLTWRLDDAQGNLIDELTEPVEFFFGGDDLLEKVEEALDGQEVGFESTLHLEPEHAFGEYDANLVFFEDRALFPENVEPGIQFEGPPEGAKTPDMPPDAIYTVTEVYPDHVVLDGNHPLAGIALRLSLVLRDIREATDEEIDARSVGQTTFSIGGHPAERGLLH